MQHMQVSLSAVNAQNSSNQRLNVGWKPKSSMSFCKLSLYLDLAWSNESLTSALQSSYFCSNGPVAAHHTKWGGGLASVRATRQATNGVCAHAPPLAPRGARRTDHPIERFAPIVQLVEHLL
eukprot:1525031-Prymnesium_polylepis.1